MIYNKSFGKFFEYIIMSSMNIKRIYLCSRFGLKIEISNQNIKYFLELDLYRNTSVYFSPIQNNVLNNILQTFQIAETLSLTYT